VAVDEQLEGRLVAALNEARQQLRVGNQAGLRRRRGAAEVA
jgi:hypothetical protein